MIPIQLEMSIPIWNFKNNKFEHCAYKTDFWNCAFSATSHGARFRCSKTFILIRQALISSSVGVFAIFDSIFYYGFKIKRLRRKVNKFNSEDYVQCFQTDLESKWVNQNYAKFTCNKNRLRFRNWCLHKWCHPQDHRSIRGRQYRPKWPKTTYDRHLISFATWNKIQSKMQTFWFCRVKRTRQCDSYHSQFLSNNTRFLRLNIGRSMKLNQIELIYDYTLRDAFFYTLRDAENILNL